MCSSTRSNRWTPAEDDAFRKMAEANIRPELIAEGLNRSVHAIKARAYAIGLPLKWFKLKARRSEGLEMGRRPKSSNLHHRRFDLRDLGGFTAEILLSIRRLVELGLKAKK